MSEFTRNNAEIDQMRLSLQKAVEAVTGDPNADPLAIFPDPSSKERRADIEWGVELSHEQELDFRMAMAELGPGREENLGASMLHLANGYTPVLEGGQAHKMIAELDLVLTDPVLPRSITVTGARDRKIGDKERELTAKLLGIEPQEVGDTEFEVACQTISTHEAFSPIPEDARMPIGGPAHKTGWFNAGYDLTKRPDALDLDYKPDSTGQLRQLGTIKRIDGRDIAVIAMRIDRFPDPEQPDEPSKYIQPSNAQKIGFARTILSANDEIEYGHPAVNNVALVSSATYEPSCKIAAMEAEKDFHRGGAFVLSYGTLALAKVKGESPSQPTIEQLGAEAFKVAKLLS